MVRSLEPSEKGELSTGKSRTLITSDPRFQHWDHAYALTGYSAQGKTVSQVILNLESYRPQLTTQPAFTVLLTRAVQDLTLYTDDRKGLLRALYHHPGEKTSALEVRGEWPDFAPSLKSNKLNPFSSPTSSLISQNDLRPPVKNPEVKVTLQAEAIRQHLKSQVEKVVEHLLGKPKVKRQDEYRYGSRQGSLVVTLSGEKRGLWHDFQTGKGGDLLNLIATQKNLDLKCDFERILKEALTLLGTTGERNPEQPFGSHSQKQNTKRLPSPKPELTLQQRRSRHYARQLARESQPLVGTLAERYLREHRGIVLANYPRAMRFHPGVYSRQNEGIYPALLVVAKDRHKRYKPYKLFI